MLSAFIVSHCLHCLLRQANMSPGCSGTCSPRSVSQRQLQDDLLQGQAPSAEAFPNSRAETEEVLLVLKRIDRTIAPYFHAFPPYSGQWEQRQSSDPQTGEGLVESPRDVTAYTSWVLEGASSFICDFDHDIREMANLIAQMRVGSIDPAVPNIPVPLFSQPSRTGNLGTTLAEWITTKYSEQGETVSSSLESYHFLEECIQGCQIRREALWMGLFELFPDVTSAATSERHSTPQALQGLPLRGTPSLGGIPIHLHSEAAMHRTDSLGISEHDPPEDNEPQILLYHGISDQRDVPMRLSRDTLPYRL